MRRRDLWTAAAPSACGPDARGPNRRQVIIALGGAALAWPQALRAQQKAMPLVGYLSSNSPSAGAAAVAGFRQGLWEAGYVEGQNVAIEYRWADGSYDRLPALAADLVGRRPNVIAATGGPAPALAAKSATSTIPIVFVSGGDPIAEGLVAGLARPGDNITGVSFLVFELSAKRFELLCELIPQARVIALLVNPSNPNAERSIENIQEAARAKGVQIAIMKGATESEVDAAFASLVQVRAGGLVVGADVVFSMRRDQLIALASRHGLPAIYYAREDAAAGGLISYGSSIAFAYLQGGTYTGKILAGAKPIDLPVVQPTKFELVVNLKTAKDLGLTVPPSILARADEVIE
jgi:putative ABC transport system substrate-binding protein